MGAKLGASMFLTSKESLVGGLLFSFANEGGKSRRDGGTTLSHLVLSYHNGHSSS